MVIGSHQSLNLRGALGEKSPTLQGLPTEGQDAAANDARSRLESPNGGFRLRWRDLGLGLDCRDFLIRLASCRSGRRRWTPGKDF